MSRSMLSHSPRAMTALWSAYALSSGTLAFGAGWGVARVAGTATVGVLTAAAVMGAAGWWGPPLLQWLQRVFPRHAQAQERALLPLD